MSDATCEGIREMIPDRAGERLDGAATAEVEGHVSACDDCRDELALARSVFESRAAVPVGLADRVYLMVRRDARSTRRPWWGISAAAVAALALGIGMASEPAATRLPQPVPGYASEAEEGELWLSDDGLLAGAPNLELLSDEALLELLDELSMSMAGGVA